MYNNNKANLTTIQQKHSEIPVEKNGAQFKQNQHV